jgi:hypothetical protein
MPMTVFEVNVESGGTDVVPQVNTSGSYLNTIVGIVFRSEFKHGDKILVSTQPVLICIYEVDENICAESEDLDIFASGNSMESALLDFEIQIADFYDHYTSANAPELMGHAIDLKRIFETQFVLS